jgi:hypothetical protein
MKVGRGGLGMIAVFTVTVAAACGNDSGHTTESAPTRGSRSLIRVWELGQTRVNLYA